MLCSVIIQPPDGKYNLTAYPLSLCLCHSPREGVVFTRQKEHMSAKHPNSATQLVTSLLSWQLTLPFLINMDTAFDNLDAAGFLEIWQHFDADGEDI